MSLKQERSLSRAMSALSKLCLYILGMGSPREWSPSQGSRPEVLLALLPERQVGWSCGSDRAVSGVQAGAGLARPGQTRRPGMGWLLGWEVGSAQHLKKNCFLKLTPIHYEYQLRSHFNLFVIIFIIN